LEGFGGCSGGGGSAFVFARGGWGGGEELGREVGGGGGVECCVGGGEGWVFLLWRVVVGIFCGGTEAFVGGGVGGSWVGVLAVGVGLVSWWGCLVGGGWVLWVWVFVGAAAEGGEGSGLWGGGVIIDFVWVGGVVVRVLCWKVWVGRVWGGVLGVGCWV